MSKKEGKKTPNPGIKAGGRLLSKGRTPQLRNWTLARTDTWPCVVASFGA